MKFEQKVIRLADNSKWPKAWLEVSQTQEKIENETAKMRKKRKEVFSALLEKIPETHLHGKVYQSHDARLEQ